MVSIGELFTKSEACRPVKRGMGPEFQLDDFDVKTLLETSTGWGTETLREGVDAVPFATRPLSLIDYVMQSPTNSDPHVYMEETTYTNNAGERAEGTASGEAALAYTERSSDVAKIIVTIPATDEQLEDVEGLPSYIDQRLGFMLRQRLEAQMLTGNGTAPNLRGILNVVGIQTQAKGADSTATAIRKAITKVRTPGEAIPSLVVVNPTDGEELDLAGAADHATPYLAGGDIWKLPKVETTAITLGTGLVGDFVNFTALKVKRGITLKVSNSHSTFFVEGKQMIRAEIRVAFPVYRPAAFCTVTGI